MNGGADDGGSHQSEDSEEREQICSQMKLKEAIECKAIENIKEAQDRYKKDYDKKHHTSKVRVMFVALCL